MGWSGGWNKVFYYAVLRLLVLATDGPIIITIAQSWKRVWEDEIKFKAKKKKK